MTTWDLRAININFLMAERPRDKELSGHTGGEEHHNTLKKTEMVGWVGFCCGLGGLLGGLGGLLLWVGWVSGWVGWASGWVGWAGWVG